MLDALHMSARKSKRPQPKRSGKKPPAKKQPLQISIDRALVKLIDAHKETRRLGSRSAFITQAILSYLKAQREREIEARIERAYDDQAAQEVFEDLQAFLPHQVWSPDDDLVESGPMTPPARSARR